MTGAHWLENIVSDLPIGPRWLRNNSGKLVKPVMSGKSVLVVEYVVQDGQNTRLQTDEPERSCARGLRVSCLKR
jgi:hypothetical protein